uniref:FAD-binding FR-type domain-containing protein n=1 Tax=Chlamydomonas euryale TaxID=1486919 RepID=A0A7R9VNR2_9CHLO|mmetsp:Transcript_40518/g.120883  ORF Transcript_40518/g.120883 Transcript_40518/m.120883 type:complete len:262 (+) Transcript_40518:743-1528(+)
MVEQQPSLADLLDRFGSCKPPLDALLDALPPLMPRLYSVTTSPAAYPAQLQVALSVVSFKTRYGTRLGVATTWLDRLVAPLLSGGKARAIQIPIYLKKADVFKPPTDLSKPVIMVGPGTGVAPFRGFLQRRAAMLAVKCPDGLPDGQLPDGVGPAWLYFGCRKPDEDYLYRSDLEGFANDRTLTKLSTAFSRLQDEKVYVQHLMRADCKSLGSMICNGGYIFVCGDGAHMVKVSMQVVKCVHNDLRDSESKGADPRRVCLC